MTDQPPSPDPSPWSPPAGAFAPPTGAAAPPSGPVAPTAPAGFDAGAPPLDYPVQSRKRRGRTGRTAVAALAVVALAGGGAFAATSLGGSGDGGADSPEAAVEQFFRAVSDEDLLGVLDALPEGERRALREPMEDLAGELRRLGVLSDDADLSGIDGVDVEFTDLELVSEDVGDGVATVRITGAKTQGSYDLSELPLGPFIIDTVLQGERPSGAGSDVGEILASEDVAITTIEEDDGWHVSLFYTIAEAARRSAGLPAPTFGAGVPADGAETPEAAVEAMLRAALALDVRQLIALSPPDEMRVLHDYAPLFIDEAEQAVDELRNESGFDADLVDVSLSSDADGDTAHVTIDRYSASVTFDGGGLDVELRDGCFLLEGIEGLSIDSCAMTDGTATEDPSVGTPFEGFDSFGLVLTVVRTDGEWYVSPTRTMMDSMVGMLGAIERTDLEDLFDGAGGLFSMLAGGEGFAEEGFDSDVGFGFEPGDAASDEGADGDGGYDTDGIDAVYDECNQVYEDADFDTPFEETRAEWRACMLRAAEEGRLPVDYLTLDTRFPECMDPALDASNDLSGEEYVALVQDAHDCLFEHVAAGDVEEDQIYGEFRFPECLPVANPRSFEMSADDYEDYYRALNECIDDKLFG